MEFGQAYCKDLLKGIQWNLFNIFTFIVFFMIFGTLNEFLEKISEKIKN
jgi:hypothetical protein